MDHILISVIMPVYNAEKYVEEAVRSILGQTCTSFELIIVDDCGTDRSMELIMRMEDRRIRILRNDSNRGIAYSRNRAIMECKGKYIAIMDDDDISFPQRFEKQADFLERHPEIDILGGAVEAIDAEGNVLRKASETLKNPLYIKVNFLFRCIFHNSEVMFRKDMIRKNHILYRENCYGMEDFCFWIECSKVGRMTNLSDVILQHRYHEETETFRVKREEYDKRKKCYGKLQRLSFTLSGFRLSEEDYDILTYSFPEGSIAELSLQEIQSMLGVVRKIISHAEKEDMDFQSELAIYLRKQICLAVQKCKDLQDADREEGVQ